MTTLEYKIATVTAAMLLGGCGTAPSTQVNDAAPGSTPAPAGSAAAFSIADRCSLATGAIDAYINDVPALVTGPGTTISPEDKKAYTDAAKKAGGALHRAAEGLTDENVKTQLDLAIKSIDATASGHILDAPDLPVVDLGQACLQADPKLSADPQST